MTTDGDSGWTEFDEEVDVVVVGFGFAGGVSAIEAHDAGARVLVLEKMPDPGGISICSHGAVCSTRDPDGAFARYREATGWNPLRDPANPPDLRSFLVGLGRTGKPHGETFRYISPNSDFLGWLLERVGGKPMAELLSEHIWRPMGARDAACITVDRLGAPRNAGGICATARDLALFGATMRDGGKAPNGMQVIPSDWVADIRNNGDRQAWLNGDPGFSGLLPEGRYRGKWYQTGNAHGAFCAIGIHGQWIYVDPAADAVIVKLSAQPEPLDDPLDRACLRCFDAICRTLA